MTNINKNKTKPAANTVKRLLEVLSSFSFNLYYIKGKDVILSSFISSLKQDTSDLHEVIPISHSVQGILHAKYYNIHEMEQERYFFQNRFQTMTRCTVFPKEHCIETGVDPNLKPEKQVVKPLTRPINHMFQLGKKSNSCKTKRR